MLAFLHYNNWSRLKNTGSDSISALGFRRNLLFSKFCIIATIAAVVQSINDYFFGFPYVALIDLGLGLFLMIGYLLNERSNHLTAKVFVFSFSNIVLFVLGGVVPKGIGVYLLFYPLLVFVIVSFDYQQKQYIYLFSALALVFNLILVATDFQPFGAINIQPADPTVSYVLNLITSFGLIVLGIDFLKTLNFKASFKLVENQQKTTQLAIALKKKNKDLEKSNKELDQFVYSVSHDLRAPLASVTGLLNLLKLEPVDIPENITNYHNMMEDRVKGLDSFIQDILDYSRNSRTGVNQVEVNINDLIKEVISHNAYLQQADKIKSIVIIKIDHPVKIDRTRIFSVLNNLVSNAVKYNDLSKPDPFIQIKAQVEKQRLKFAIKDSGEGICEACKDHVFDMFYRGTQSSSGSGLGLYITKEMVEKLGGSISFTSEEGVGSEFEFSIPL